MAKPKLKHPSDIIVTDALPHKEAETVLADQARTLTRMGRGKTHSVYMVKWGRGWAVVLHDRSLD